MSRRKNKAPKNGVNVKSCEEQKINLGEKNVSFLADDIDRVMGGRRKESPRVVEQEVSEVIVGEDHDIDEEDGDEDFESTKKYSFKVPVDIATSVANLWSRGLKEMQKRGILSSDCDIPRFFRAESFPDGSLLLRVINIPNGIVMVGDSGGQLWNVPQHGSVSQESIVDLSPAMGSSETHLTQGIRNLYISDDGDVKVE